MPVSNAQLLLVDDDPAAIHAMRHLLSEYVNLRFAASGDEALRLAQAQPPDLIVLDAQMPGIDGLAVCAALRRDPRLRDVPVIMATAQPPGALELAAIEQGVADFVTKPLVPETFRARVRAHLRQRQRQALPAPPPAAPHKPALLIVDDDVAAVHLLGTALQELGTVHFVTDGDTALQRAQEIAPGLVVLDAHMPAVDGFAVCRALKNHATLHTVPVVFVTRYDDAACETRALDLGAADFISKPYAAAVLRARVRNLLELKRRTDADLQAVRDRWRRLADARLADAVRNAPDAMLSCDAALQVVFANAAAERLFGRGAGALVALSLAELLPEPARLLAQAAQAPQRVLVTRPDGRQLPAEATASTVVDAGGALTMLVLRETADRERLEAALRARAAAEASSQAKTRMIGVIAHEMGNPLHAVLGFAQLLRPQLGESASPSAIDTLDQVVHGARRLERLLDDLREFARHESGALQLVLDDVDLPACVAEVLDALAPQAQEAGVHLQALPAPVAPLHVRADARRLHQCLANLVSNAIKYGRRGGRVTVDVVPDAGRLRIDVHDDGLGMDALQVAALFEPFNRLGRERSNIPGTGLGLFITRQLVQAMGGELLVASRPGAGSTFGLRLPAC